MSGGGQHARGMARSWVPAALACLAHFFRATSCLQRTTAASAGAITQLASAEVAPNLHGDYHPPVTIRFPRNALSQRHGLGSALRDMQLRLSVDGCVLGFEYQLIAAHVSREADSVRVLKAWDRIFVGTSSGNLDLTATFASPAKCERCRFQVVLYDLYANLSLDERKVSANSSDAPLCPGRCASVWSCPSSACAIHRAPGAAAEW